MLCVLCLVLSRVVLSPVTGVGVVCLGSWHGPRSRAPRKPFGRRRRWWTRQSPGRTAGVCGGGWGGCGVCVWGGVGSCRGLSGWIQIEFEAARGAVGGKGGGQTAARARGCQSILITEACWDRCFPGDPRRGQSGEGNSRRPIRIAPRRAQPAVVQERFALGPGSCLLNARTIH